MHPVPRKQYSPMVMGAEVWWFAERSMLWVRSCERNPATVVKLTDRGSIQTVGVVTDAEPFLRALVAELAKG